MFDLKDIQVYSLVIQKIVQDHQSPWIDHRIDSCGTAFRFNKWLITNEHVVRGACFVGLADRPIQLKVLYLSKVHDLALLSLPDSSQGVLQELADTIKVGDEVTIIGFPRGGTTVAVSHGTINRLVELPYNGVENNLAFQLSTATDLGSSGSPVLKLENENPKLVGVASYRAVSIGRLADARDACFLIPFVVVEHFLECFKRSYNPAHLCRLSVTTSHSLSPILRRHYLGSQDRSGILISRSNCVKIQSGDFLHQINDHVVDNLGMVKYEPFNCSVPYWFLIKLMYAGDHVSLTLLRSQVVKIDLELATLLESVQPKYLKVRNSLTFTEENGLVVLSEFDRATTVGYRLEAGLVLVSANEVDVDTLSDVADAISNVTVLKFEFGNGDIVIL